jgi:hypothetical protein
MSLDTVEAISTERKLGQAHMNLGQYTSAREHFIAALTNLGITIPSDKTKVKSALKKVTSLEKKKKGEMSKSGTAFVRQCFFLSFLLY